MTDPMHSPEPSLSPAPTKKGGAAVPIVASAILVLAVGGGLLLRAESKRNKATLAAEPKPVTVIEAAAGKYRANRAYVATVEPWVEAKVGPQLVSAYVDTVLVRPGSVVKKGEVLATLDCKSASAQAQNVAMQARALDARQKAAANEAARMQGLVGKGFVAENEAEQKAAQSAAEEAQLLAAKAKLLGTSLEVNDCVLRAPFEGEVAQRMVDPGAFVKPATFVVTLVDRSTVRISGEAPETDFAIVAPGTKVKVSLVSTKRELEATIARRSPSADPQTRTVHFELDVHDPERTIPVGTTAEVKIDVGEAMSVTELPLVAATIKGSKASVFVVEDGKAKAMSVAVKGEAAGKVYLAQDLKPGSKVVTEGRALLNDGDPVNAKVAAPPKEEKKDEKKEEKKEEKKPEPAPSASHGGKAP
ncbi:MAG: efflux RND transporter periplasmic adaptor subunit [Polyangiaceae bacterium]